MFSGVSDKQLIILWHSVNPSVPKIMDSVDHDNNKERINEILRGGKHDLWATIDKECSKRKLDPEQCTKTQIVTQTVSVDL